MPYSSWRTRFAGPALMKLVDGAGPSIARLQVAAFLHAHLWHLCVRARVFRDEHLVAAAAELRM